MKYRHPADMTDFEYDLLGLIYEICNLKEKADKEGGFITSDEFDDLLNKRYQLLDKTFGYHHAQECANSETFPGEIA